MSWEVEFTDEFGTSPSLGFPHSSKVNGSRHSGMRELRTQSGGKPLRTLYIFDPLRTAILLVGGDKTGKDGWHEQFVPVADRIYQQYLDELGKKDMGGENELAFEKFREEFGMIRERLRHIEASALRQLRSPQRARHLRALLAARGKL